MAWSSPQMYTCSMSGLDRPTGARTRLPARQAGAFTIEFTLLVLLFFMFLFGVIELSRAMYVWNTLPEVTRRAASAAASANFLSAGSMNLIREQAVFRDSPGVLLAGAPVTDEHVRIDYLALVRNADGSLQLTPIDKSMLPTSTANNRVNCMSNPNGTNCVRFVRARICEPGPADACGAVTYQPIVPLITFSLPLPTSPAVVQAGSLGYSPGMALTP